MDVHGTDRLVSRLDTMDGRRVWTKKSFLRTEMFGSGGGEWMPGMKAANGYKKLPATFLNFCYVC